MALHLPAEFINKLKVRLGREFPDFIESLEKPAPVSIRYNQAKSSTTDGEMVPWCRSGRYLAERPQFTLDPRIHAGMYYVQEASSMFLEQCISQSVDLSKSLNVLDLCAAPGGKSTHLASLITSDSLLVSNETIRSRASILAENITKWGFDNVIVTQNDPSDLTHMNGFFDLIVVDAPCTGEGLFRKDPGAIKEWSPQHVAMCSLRQRRIVSDVWPSLKEGGVVIYSTCTYNDEENIDNLVWLSQQSDIESISIKTEKKWGIEEIKKNKLAGYQFFPHHLKGEGLFMSVIRKNEKQRPVNFSRNPLKLLTDVRKKEISSWVKKPESKVFFLNNNTINFFPVSKLTELQAVAKHLHIIQAGTPMAEIMRNKLVPDHAIALSTQIMKSQFNYIPLSREQALDYLSKNNIELPMEKAGFALVGFDDLPLGWVNILPNRINSLYPSSWRIRMSH